MRLYFGVITLSKIFEFCVDKCHKVVYNYIFHIDYHGIGMLYKLFARLFYLFVLLVICVHNLQALEYFVHSFDTGIRRNR